MKSNIVLNWKAMLVGLAAISLSANAAEPQFWSWASTPPMGWNSWDCFATTVTEAQTKAQADVMAAQLKQHGWQYIVVDIQWYEPGATSFAYRQDASLVSSRSPTTCTASGSSSAST